MYLRLSALAFAVIAIVAGVAMIYPPAGIITAGLLVGAAVLLYDDEAGR